MPPPRASSDRSERFLRAQAQMRAIVRELFPNAEEGVLYKLPGWQVPLPPEKVRKGAVGTMDPSRAYILLKDGASAITVHLWNPLDYHALEPHRRRLESAGFQVMVGCVRWTRKSDVPIAELGPLLRATRKQIFGDGKLPAAEKKAKTKAESRRKG